MFGPAERSGKSYNSGPSSSNLSSNIDFVRLLPPIGAATGKGWEGGSDEREGCEILAGGLLSPVDPFPDELFHKVSDE